MWTSGLLAAAILAGAAPAVAAGAIEGAVTYAGSPPALPAIPVEAEHHAACGSEVPNDALLVDAATKGLSNAVVLTLAPMYGKFDELVTSVVAWRRITRATVQIVKAGAPSNLDVSVELGEDPFTGKTLRYAKSGNGFRVWSTGPDHRDDAGMTRRESQNYDLVSVIPPFVNPKRKP